MTTRNIHAGDDRVILHKARLLPNVQQQQQFEVHLLFVMHPPAMIQLPLLHAAEGAPEFPGS
jgi:hypothetical protein